MAISAVASAQSGLKVDTIEITQFKTTQVIFEKNISFVEAGTGELQVKTKMVDNVLILQSIASGEEFITTNLFIKTDDNIYNPIIKYSANPKVQTIFEASLKSELNLDREKSGSSASSSSATVDKGVVAQTKMSPQDAQLYNVISNQKEEFKPSRAYETGMWAKFHAHYIKGNKFYFKVEFDNTTDLAYKIEHIFFSIKSVKKRNASVTQKEITPTRVINDSQVIEPRTKKFLIFEFNSFSINKDEEFWFECKEKDGARNLVFGVPYYIINKPLTLK